MSAINVVYVVQSGETGPILIGTATDRGLRRHVAALQRGNPEHLIIRRVLDGDERLERRLHVALSTHHLRADWYEPPALDDLPDDLPDAGYDVAEEQRRLAALTLRELAGSGR